MCIYLHDICISLGKFKGPSYKRIFCVVVYSRKYILDVHCFYFLKSVLWEFMVVNSYKEILYKKEPTRGGIMRLLKSGDRDVSKDRTL